ncbi:phosphotransferase [Brachybacterium sp. FME24]|uniref:phosphotransferase n=1 Tax=Brachybacterium sp. FME24 TaxID=2742605 RepID=UPI0018674ABC|nr:phosphotransferase [Brachybacterium sp. FME24]
MHARSPDVDEVSFVEGTTAVDVVLNHDQVESLGRLLRSLHDASASFDALGADAWQPFEFRATTSTGTFGGGGFLSEIVVGHGDTGPWNVLTTSERSVSLIDWEFAGPIVRLDEIAASCWLNIRFHDPDVDAVAPLTGLREKVALLEALLSGYGLPRDLWPAVVHAMSDYAIRDTAYEATRLDITASQVTADESAEWRLAWRSRSAAWIVRHRAEIVHLLEV